MHVLVQTGLDNMQAWRHGQACMETMMPRRVGLVAPQNVIFHPVEQLASPTLDVFLLRHLNWCTQPNGPRAAVHPMEQGRHVHPNRGAEVPTQERQRIQAAVRVLQQGQGDGAVRPYCVLILVLLLVEVGLSHQVLDESQLPRVKLGYVGYPFLVYGSQLSGWGLAERGLPSPAPPKSPESCPSSSTRLYGSAHSVNSGRMTPRRRGFTMFPGGSLTRTDTSSFRVLAMMRSKSTNCSAMPGECPHGSRAHLCLFHGFHSHCPTTSRPTGRLCHAQSPQEPRPPSEPLPAQECRAQSQSLLPTAPLAVHQPYTRGGVGGPLCKPPEDVQLRLRPAGQGV